MLGIAVGIGALELKTCSLCVQELEAASTGPGRMWPRQPRLLAAYSDGAGGLSEHVQFRGMRVLEGRRVRC